MNVVNPMDDPATNAFAPEAASIAPAPEPVAEKAELPASGAGKEEPLIEKAAKRRTWKKPKDKPKRPLSSYNIFFQHARTRIVEGHTEEARPEEIARSIEWILTKSRERRRHRKTHGRISFGDLARTIADKWKTVDPQRKAIFDQYAEVDMHRYRNQVKIWKDKKEREEEAASMGGVDGGFRLNDFPFQGTMQQGAGGGASWQPRNQFSLHESLHSSYPPVASCESELSLEPMPINMMQMQEMQMQQQQHRYHQQQQQQLYQHVYQQQQANSQASFIANANQGFMPSFPAIGGGYGNASFNMMAPGNYGNASINSLAPNDSLLGVSSSQVSDYASNHTSGHTSGGFYAPGSWGLAPRPDEKSWRPHIQ